MAKSKIDIKIKAVGKEEAEVMNIGLSGAQSFLEKNLDKNGKAYKVFNTLNSIFRLSFSEREKEEIEIVEVEEIKE